MIRDNSEYMCGVHGVGGRAQHTSVFEHDRHRPRVCNGGTRQVRSGLSHAGAIWTVTDVGLSRGGRVVPATERSYWRQRYEIDVTGSS